MTQLVLTELLSILGDASVVNAGLVRQWDGATPPVLTTESRTVTVIEEVDQHQAVPYVRVAITDTALLDDEPHGYTYSPEAERMRAVCTVFSDWHTEAAAIALAIQELLKHRQIETDDFRGWSWMEEPIRYFTDNTGDTAAIYRVAALTFRIIVEPK